MFNDFDTITVILQLVNHRRIFANDLNHVVVVNNDFSLQQLNPRSDQMLQLLNHLVRWQSWSCEFEVISCDVTVITVETLGMHSDACQVMVGL